VSGEFAGALRERVTIEQRSGTRDALAGATGTYVYSGAAWAAVEPIAAGPDTAAQSRSALPRWRVTLRKREGVNLATRLVWRGRFLAVRGVESDPRQPAQMLLSCEEVR
jgi:head-tail adaptor